MAELAEMSGERTGTAAATGAMAMAMQESQRDITSPSGLGLDGRTPPAGRSPALTRVSPGGSSAPSTSPGRETGVGR